jgi:hypothetical protein
MLMLAVGVAVGFFRIGSLDRLAVLKHPEAHPADPLSEGAPALDRDSAVSERLDRTHRLAQGLQRKAEIEAGPEEHVPRQAAERIDVDRFAHGARR